MPVGRERQKTMRFFTLSQVNGPGTLAPAREVGDRDVKVILDVVIVLVIVSIGGFFASAEMALVSLREGQVRSLAKRGRRGAKAAKLASDPNRFLASVQIGTTLAMLVSGAYGATTLAGVRSGGMVGRGMSHDAAAPLAFAI